MGEVVLKRSDPGSPLKYRLSISKEEYGIYFNQQEWSAMVRYSLQAAGAMWMQNYLPLRFTNYSRSVGLYTGKKRKDLPLVESGRLRQHTLTASRPEVPHNGSYLDLVIPDTYIVKDNPSKRNYDKGVLNYSANPVVRASLSRITEREVERIAVTFDATMQSLIANADKKVFKSGVKVISGAGEGVMIDKSRIGKTKNIRLTSTQRTTLGLKVRARTTATTAPRSI